MDNPFNAQELLKKALERLSQKEVATRLGKTPRTLRRWLSGEVPIDPARVPAIEQLCNSETKEALNVSKDFTFIDLFAGIGGIRKGFESQGGKCVFTSEWDSYAQKTYLENFVNDHPLVGDINDIMEIIDESIPDHDVLLAGFPCQPFSIAGVSKKNSLGRVHGFACQEQGNLFFKVADILQQKRPKAFMLENVKNLQSHDRGKTFRIIMETLEEVLGYKVFWKVIDGKGFVPQHRERIFIVGFDGDTDFSWDDINIPAADAKTMKEILHPSSGEPVPEEPYTDTAGKVNSKYILSDKLWSYLQRYAEKHRAKGNGFGFGLVGPNDVARTLSARYYKDGSEILVKRGSNKNPRRLTPRECARLMGFTDEFKIPVSDTRAYKQFGNCVIVPVIQEIARIMKPHILQTKEQCIEKTAAVING